MSTDPIAREIPVDELAEAQHGLAARLDEVFRVHDEHPRSAPDAATELDEARRVAHLFHETYERLAPEYGYETREASAKPWDEVPSNNRLLMIATVDHVLRTLDDERGRERDAARAEVEQLRSRMAEGANAAFKCPDGLHPTWMLDPSVECPWCEVERLRARDEAAKAVVQWWVDADGAGDRDELTRLLDALARAHEDGGTDR